MRKMIILLLCLLLSNLLLTGTISHAQDDEPANLILAWLGDGETPSNIVQRGNIVLMDGQGAILNTIAPVTANDSFVTTCTEQPISPDGNYHAFYVGGNTGGNLYITQSNAEITPIPNINAYTCLGMGSFVWQKDSQSFAYINYENTENIPYGQLVIRPTQDANQTLYTSNNIASFDYQPDKLSTVEVYRDTLRVHYGTLEGGLNEVARLFTPNEGCVYRSAHVEQINAETLAVLSGYRCNNVNRLNLNLINIPSRINNLALNIRTGQNEDGIAAFSAQTSTSTIFSTTDGKGLYVTYPDGVLGNYSVAIRPITMGRPFSISDQITSLMIMARLPLSNPSATPALSRDGRYLTFTQQTADVVSSQYIYDLSAYGAITSAVLGSRGDTISSTVFSPDSQSLYLISGGVNGQPNAIMKLNVHDQALTEIVRGNFLSPLILSPDGNHALVLQQEIGGVNNLPYVDLQRVNLESGQTELVFAGSDLGADGRFTRRQFAVPLFWLKAS
jgi:hypothetical protein